MHFVILKGTGLQIDIGIGVGVVLVETKANLAQFKWNCQLELSLAKSLELQVLSTHVTNYMVELLEVSRVLKLALPPSLLKVFD